MTKKQPNIVNILKVFKANYKPIPLEVFKDPYKVLISTMLSSRTNDDITVISAKRLFKKAPNIHKLGQLKQSEISNLIYPVGFYKTKAKNLKKISQIIISKYNGNVPKTRINLMALPGVGRKTANLVLIRAFSKNAISVDTHVHRISNLLNLVNTNSPQKTELQLIKVVPKTYWKDINKYFVSIGRQYRSSKKLEEFLKENNLI
jgi:endonuclease-3